MPAAVSLGVAGSLGPAAIARIGRAAEAAGLFGLWVNDTPDGDALDGLAAAAATTTRLQLATGVLPVDRRRAEDIVARAADLPAERLTLGIGSGAARTGQLALVERAVDVLRRGTAATVMVGALGPRMRRLAAEHADGPLLSWLSPALAAVQSGEGHAVGPGTHVALYVRAALDAAAVPRLRQETARYAGFPNYAANYARLDLHPDETVLGPDGFAERLAAYRDAVDEVVLRAIVADDRVEEYERFAETAGALVQEPA